MAREVRQVGRRDAMHIDLPRGVLIRFAGKTLRFRISFTSSLTSWMIASLTLTFNMSLYTLNSAAVQGSAAGGQTSASLDRRCA